jgi:hypothetical protein
MASSTAESVTPPELAAPKGGDGPPPLTLFAYLRSRAFPDDPNLAVTNAALSLGVQEFTVEDEMKILSIFFVFISFSALSGCAGSVDSNGRASLGIRKLILSK